jgi:integration host factor subunit beta
MKFPDITQRDIEMAVNGIFEGMKRKLLAGGRIELRGFGSMEVRVRRPRAARNPKTGRKVNVGSRRTAVFFPGKELSAALKGADEEPIPGAADAAHRHETSRDAAAPVAVAAEAVAARQR